MSILVDHIPSLSGKDGRAEKSTQATTGLLGQMMTGDLIPEKTFESLAGKLLLLLVVVLMCIGVLAVYSSGAGWGASKFQSEAYFLWRQAAYALMALLVIFVVGGMDYKWLKKVSKAILVVSILLLAALLVLKGLKVIDGAARWIGYGRFKFQASDLAKYALIVHLAAMIADKRAYIKDVERAYYPMLMVIVTIGSLVAFEPNFSTAAVIMLIGFAMLFLAGASLMHLGLTALAILPLAASFALMGYRKDRLLSFIGAGDERINYQIEQALIGLGNGGLTGLGIGASKQRELFLPASYNDFIFAVFGEEYGFIGAVALLLLFGGVVVCGVLIAQNALDDFGKFLGYGITVALGLYAFINAGVACHLLPTTGLPMPFVSFGGSAMLFNAFGVGVLLSISRERKRQAKKNHTSRSETVNAQER